jgi:hypothetical protein
MTEKFDGPVRVVGDDRQTIVGDTTLIVGQKIPSGGGLGPGSTAEHAPTTAGASPINEEAGGSTTEATGPFAHVVVGDRGIAGAISVVDKNDNPVISLGGGVGSFGTGKQAGGVTVRGASNGPLIAMTGNDGRITFLDKQLNRTLIIDGIRGDIEFIGADCAEDFDMGEPASPGSVVTIDEHGLLRPCREAYDRRVIGVLSGAGDHRPGLRLNRSGHDGVRQPLALIGKVFCFVDAGRIPVNVGDLLTTSETEGHAMRAIDTTRAFGAVLGKSLGSLRHGRGLVPVLVTLQ